MKLESLKLMKCPYCGSDFHLGEIYRENNIEIIDGIVLCECNEYPILDGILFLKAGHMNNYLRILMGEGKIQQAVKVAIEKFGERFCELDNILRLKGLYGRFLGNLLSIIVKTRANLNYNKYSDDNIPFCSMLGNGSFDIYLKNRFSADTFWSLYPFIPLIKERRERILDLSCGMGHSSFILSTYLKPDELICADYSFRNLYLAKKYFVEDVALVCLDANHSLPFKDGIFSSIIMLDAFHYIRGQSSLAKEMERVIPPSGLLLLLHLHNKLEENLAAGQPLTPNGWSNLFQNMRLKLLPEKSVVEDFVYRNKIDLVKDYSQADLNSSDALVIVGGGNTSNLYIHQDIWASILDNKDNLIINPCYTIERKGDSVILIRKFPSESFKNEYHLMKNYLPEECIINGMAAKAITGRTLDISSIKFSEYDQLLIEDLMRKFVIINVPKNYI